MTKLNNNMLNSIAHNMLQDYDSKAPGTIFKKGLHLSLGDARRVQNAITNLREKRGEMVVGLKIGCTSKYNQKKMGLSHPVWGRLWSTEQYSNNTILHKKQFTNVALEAEFAISLCHTLEPNKTSLNQLVMSVDAIYPVIEIHNFAIHGSKPHGAELIANNAIHAGTIFGKKIKHLKGNLITNLSLHFDDEIVDSWNAIQWPKDILTGLKWLVQEYAKIGKKLNKGDLVLTGALGPPIPLGEKKKVEVKSSAFGDVCATFL